MQRVYAVFLSLLLPLLTQAQFNATEVQLNFTAPNGQVTTATATDNGSGLMVGDAISLMESTDYSVSIVVRDGSTDLTSTIVADGASLQFFFVASEGTLADLDYTDTDSNGLPIGLDTDLTTDCTEEGDVAGTFRVALNDLGSSKSSTSTIASGSSLFDLTWDITIVDDADAPSCENEEEVIDRVTLTFTPADGSAPVVAIASDPDGPGPLDLQVEDTQLMESTDYELSIMLENTIEGEDITEEIEEEAAEHQFFFGFSEMLFDRPNGDGNIDNRDDEINYNDFDFNGLPVGLSTNWTTACTEDGNPMGDFRVILKHQPDIKSPTTTVEDGGTDIDITWNITVVDDPDAPACENEEELIDRVTLTFTPADGGAPVVAVATDPDGPGPLDLQVEDIQLMESTDYEMSVTLENTIEGEDITEEIEEEAEEHQFFFAFNEMLFESPDGDGNIDDRDDPINYNDFDANGLPVGLSTDWTTACTEEGNVMGDFRVVLKHQPDIKSPTTGFEDGGTDIDITWNITVVDDPDAPGCENEEEVIDRVTLTFTPADGGAPVVAVATDPDGPGPLDLQVEAIELLESTDYELSVTLENTIEGEDITEEIEEEAEEHQFFFAFNEMLFESPDGDGNIDDRDDPINYNDFDANGLPVGLSTDWTTACTEEGNVMGDFRVVLKHQPDIKSPTTGFEDGGTDIDITWNITVVDDPDAPGCENEEEVIDRVTLTFTPADGSEPVVAVATDPDGPGPLDLQVEAIALQEGLDYELSIMLENTIEGEDITEEIEEEAEEHQFFFAFDENLFESPMGDGNIDDRNDPINYLDFDANGLPVGLSTLWEAVCLEGGNTMGEFRVVLKHQPDIKSPTTGFEDGGTDIDITWNMEIVDAGDSPACATGADLAVTVSADKEEVDIFERVTVTVELTNNGPEAATGVNIFAPNPEGTVFSNVSTSAGNYGVVTRDWEVASIAAGETVTLELVLFTLVENQEIPFVAEITASDVEDENPDNNSASLVLNEGQVIATEDADLELAIDADVSRFDIFRNVTFTITLTNNGPETTSDVAVAAMTPMGTAFTMANASVGSYGPVSGVWSIESIAAGETATLEVIVLTLSDDAPITFYTEVVASFVEDPDSTPNNGDGTNANEDDEAVLTLLPAMGLGLGNNTSANALLTEVFPNPASTELNVSFYTALEEVSQINVFDARGRLVLSQAVELVQGSNTLFVEVAELTTGLYFFQLEGTTLNFSFVKQ